AISRPNLEVEIRRFFWDEPSEPKLTKMDLCYLSLALTPRPQDFETNYLWSYHTEAFQSLGNCCFQPANQPVLGRACIGEYQEICCLFDKSLLEPYRDWEWTPLELAACIDIKNINIRAGLLRLADEVA